MRGPLAPPPHEHAGWVGRWDDPERAFSTLYVASDPRTAIREVLAPSEAVAIVREAVVALGLVLVP